MARGFARSDEELNEITDKMAGYVSSFISPLCYANEVENDARPGGTGNFIQVGEGICILTNYHVITKKENLLLSYFLGNAKPAQAIGSPFTVLKHPLDLGIVRIPKSLFDEGDKKPISLAFLGDSSGLSEELLFVQGFPERGPNGQLLTVFSRFANGVHFQPLGFTTIFKNDEGPESFDIDFPRAGFISADWVVNHTGNPGGLSGSLVWNCHFRQNKEWSPRDAKIVGIVRKWDDKRQTLMCTRVEIIKGFISRFGISEAAYYRWLDNGSPENTALDDWLWAEEYYLNLIFGSE